VEEIRPITPEVRSASKILRNELPMVLPNSSVQSSKFPSLRRGMIFCAARFSFSSPASAKISSDALSRLSKPSVSPEQAADRQTSPADKASVAPRGSPMP
jgi:hypothetical protein